VRREFVEHTRHFQPFDFIARLAKARHELVLCVVEPLLRRLVFCKGLRN